MLSRPVDDIGAIFIRFEDYLVFLWWFDNMSYGLDCVCKSLSDSGSSSFFKQVHGCGFI